ncbi:MAG: hypothetical protein M1829_003373 [Trizodia sp. TS-e1964]|nr:MAG: hypothetical protein M1829_003373 [Trizodia sp. TS-e1964]
MGYISPTISDAVTFTLLAIAVSTTAVRLYCRKVIFGVVGVDDYLILAATIFGIILAPLRHIKIHTLADIYYSLVVGTKIDTSIFFSPKFVSLAPISFATGFIYITELALIKLAIVAFYHRITPLKIHRYLLYAVAFCIIAYSIANHLASFFQFDPIAASWDRTIKGANTRYRPEDLTVSNSGFQISTDVILLLLPIPILRSLQTSRKTKVGLALLFALGIFAMIASAVRLSRTIILQKATGLDGLLAAPPLEMWTDFEVNVAIICANLPALSSLFQWVRKQRKLAGASSAAPIGSASYGVSKESKPLSSSNGNTTRGSDENVVLEKNSGITRMTEFSMDVEANGAYHQPTGNFASSRPA